MRQKGGVMRSSGTGEEEMMELSEEMIGKLSEPQKELYEYE